MPETGPAFVTQLVGGDTEIVRLLATGRHGVSALPATTATRSPARSFSPPSPSLSRAIGLSRSSPHRTSRAANELPSIAGRPGKGGIDRGATVCACFGVGANEIAAAVARGCTTVAAVGEALQAGTNCGSCRAEIRTIIDAQRSAAAALALAAAS